MLDELIAKIREHGSDNPERSLVADRLLGVWAESGRDFIQLLGRDRRSGHHGHLGGSYARDG